MREAQKHGKVKSIRLKKEVLEVHIRLTGEKLARLLQNLDNTYRIVRLEIKPAPGQAKKLVARLAVDRK